MDTENGSAKPLNTRSYIHPPSPASQIENRNNVLVAVGGSGLHFPPPPLDECRCLAVYSYRPPLLHITPTGAVLVVLLRRRRLLPG